jgi:hypothetical protein
VSDITEARSTAAADIPEGADETFLREPGLPGEVVIDEENLSALTNYLEEELGDVYEGQVRQEFLDRVEVWRKQRRARPLQASKDFPFDGASNLATPMTLQNTNTVSAKLKARVQQRDPRLQVETWMQQYKNHAKALERTFNRLNKSPQHINIEELDNDISYDTASLGTVTVEVPWVSEQVMIKRRTSDGGAFESIQKVVYEGPKPQAAQFEYFLIRPEYKDAQIAPWCAFVRPLMGYELEYEIARGFFDPTLAEQVKATPSDDEPQTIEEDRQNRGLVAEIADAQDDTFEIMKVYVRWDADGDKIPEDLIVWYAYDSQIIIRIEHNQMGRRPISTFRYFKLPFEYYAMGLGEMSEYSQREVDTAHNIRVDGIKLHSLQMFVYDRSTGIQPNERLFPGKMMGVAGDVNKFKTITFPDVSNASERMEMIARQYVDISAGINDLQKGRPDSVGKSGSRLGSQVMQMQAGDSIFDSITSDFLRTYGEMFQFEVMQCVVNGERAKRYINQLADPEDVELLNEVWNMNVEDIPYRFSFTVRTTKAEETKEAKRQAILTLTQMFDLFTDKILQMQMAIESGQLPPATAQTAMQFMNSRYKLMDDTFKLLSSDDDGETMPYYQHIDMMAQMIEMMQKQQSMMMKEQLNAAKGQMEAAGGGTGLAGPTPEGGPAGTGAAPSPGPAGPGSAGDPNAGAGFGISGNQPGGLT